MNFAIIGHRGAMAEAPENTIAAYLVAEEIGVDEIETDVRISADGQLFMLHDATLDRVAADPAGRDLGPVAELPWSVIGDVDVGAGERVPTLAQMYEATSTTIQLEIKDPAAIDGLITFFDDHPRAAARTILTSFSAEAMAVAADRLPRIPRGIIVSSWTAAEDHPGGAEVLIKETASTRVHSGWIGLGAETVERLHRSGQQVHGWPTRTEADLRLALELGVDGTTCDDPRAVKGWLLARG